MHRRLHVLAVTLVALLAMTGWTSARLSSLAAPVRAQVVTPDPSPPSFENQRFVIVSDNITKGAEANPTTFATGDLPDPAAYPVTSVLVHNHQGDLNEQRFWLSVRISQQDPGVEVVPEPGYAQMGLIAPGGDATYTVTFPETSTAQVVFEVDGSTDEAAMLTLLQFALDAGFTAADLTGLGGHDAEIGLDLAQVVAEQYLADLPSFVPCSNAVAAVQRGLADQEQFTRDLQGCLESPIWQASVDQVLTRVAEQDWFQQSLNLAGTAVPAVGAALKTVKAGQFAAQVWGMYQKFHPEVPGAMVGTVAFLGIGSAPSSNPVATPTVANAVSSAIFRGNPSHTGEQPGVSPQGLPTLLWRADLRGMYTTPAVSDGVVYATYGLPERGQREGEGFLVALDVKTGQERWRSEPMAFRAIAAPTVAGSTIYVGTVGNIYGQVGFLIALDATDGKELWRFPTTYHEEVGSSPSIVDGVIYFGSGLLGGRGAVYAITGTQLDISESELKQQMLAAFEGAGTYRWQSFDLHDNRTLLETGEVNLQQGGRYEDPDGTLLYRIPPRLYAQEADGTWRNWNAYVTTADGLVDHVEDLSSDDPERAWKLISIEPVDENQAFVFHRRLAPKSTGDLVHDWWMWINADTFLPLKMTEQTHQTSSESPFTWSIEYVYSDFGAPIEVHLPPEAVPAGPLTSDSPTEIARGFIDVATSGDFVSAQEYFAPDDQPDGWEDVFGNFQGADISPCFGVAYQEVERQGTASGVPVSEVSFVFDSDCAIATGEGTSNTVRVSLEQSTGYWYVHNVAVLDASQQ